MKVTRKCNECGIVVESNFHKFCADCRKARGIMLKKAWEIKYRDKLKQNTVNQALTENKAIRAASKVPHIPQRVQLMTDAEQRVIDAAAPRHIDRPLQDPRNRFITLGAGWLWGAV